VYFKKTDYNNQESFFATLNYIQPTLFFGVPEIFLHIKKYIKNLISDSTYFKQRLGN